MKDPTQEILDGIETVLSGNLTYGSTTFSIVQDVPRVDKYRHVWINQVRVEEDGTDDKFISNIGIDIEIVASGFKQRGQRKVVNNISNQLLELLIVGDVTLTNFVVTHRPHSPVLYDTTEVLDDDIINKKYITMSMKVQEI